MTPILSGGAATVAALIWTEGPTRRSTFGGGRSNRYSAVFQPYNLDYSVNWHLKDLG